MKAPTASRRSISWAASSAPNGGRAIFAFFNEIDDFAHAHEDDAELKDFVAALTATKPNCRTARCG